MKNILSLACLLLPLLAVGQQKANALEISGLAHFTDYTNKLASTEGRLAYGFGISLAMPVKNTRMEWLAGLRFASYGDKWESEDLRFGTQHDGNGGFNEDLPSGELVTGLRQVSSNYYLELPVALRWRMGEGKARFVAQAHAGPALYLTSQSRNTTELVGQTETNYTVSGSSANFRTLNAVAGAGAGLELQIAPKASLLFLAHGQSQLFSIVQASQTGAKWYAFGLQGGLRFGL